MRNVAVVALVARIQMNKTSPSVKILPCLLYINKVFCFTGILYYWIFYCAEIGRNSILKLLYKAFGITPIQQIWIFFFYKSSHSPNLRQCNNVS